MPEFHKLNKTRTTEMSKEELHRRLKEEAGKSAARQSRQPNASGRKQRRISEQTRSQMPPSSPERRRREEERRRREKEEQKARKRRKRGNYIIYYVMLAAAAFIIFSILSVTVLFNAEGIEIEGETVYSDEEIIEASGFKGDENLIRLNTMGVDKKMLKALVSLDSAEITKQFFPPRIKIKVAPAEPMINFYYAGKNYVISYEGRVMQIESSAADCVEVIGYRPGENVVIGDYITAADPQQDETVKTITALLDETGLENFTKLDISDMLAIKMTYEDRIEINLGSILQLEQKLIIIKELIENYIGENERVTLDVSNPERVVQRPLTPLVTSVVTTTPPESSETEETGETEEQPAEE